MRAFLRKYSPNFLLAFYRRAKKNKINKKLVESQQRGEAITKDDLIRDLRNAGINNGDSLLVHSSLSQIGFVENGAPTVVHALLETIGETGNLLMPNSPNSGLQLDYIRSNRVFDVRNETSRLGVISEYFRKLPNADRSCHPTEPVSCIGPDSIYFTAEHFGCVTPYSSKSPFYKIIEKEGKILYLGVTLSNAGTNLHTLEDQIENFKFPVYYPEVFEVEVINQEGVKMKMKTKVHNPEQSAKRRCDELIPHFKTAGICKEVKIGKASALLFDAKMMLDWMITEYNKHGVTMYTPEGSQ